ncbi:MAG: hypothetical protein R2724_31370 [Bryobacterales bacterium]
MASWFCCALFYYPVFQEPAVVWAIVGCLLFAGVATGFQARLASTATVWGRPQW